MSNLARRAYLPLLDSVLIFSGLALLKNFWASYYHHDAGYYDSSFLWVNAPLYTVLWLAGVYFSGGYEEQGNLRRLLRGLVVGTLFIAAVYGFLDMAYRSSRALILLGAAWSATGMIVLRTALHLARYGNLNVGRESQRQVVIVGSLEESRRVLRLLQQAQAPVHCIGMVSPQNHFEPADFLGSVSKLQDIALIYRINEIIFCAADVPSQEIMRQMTKIGPHIAYKIVPEDSLSIIGSQSKNAPGELYTIEVRFDIAQDLHRRNKRLLDLALAGLLLFSLPVHLLFVKNRTGLIANILQVLFAQKTWVGYASGADSGHTLPALRPGVLSPLDALPQGSFRPDDAATIQRLNMLYAKNYRAENDLEIVLKGYRRLGVRQ